jgi:hypothetical protein
VSLRPVMPIPLQTKLSIFEYYSNWHSFTPALATRSGVVPRIGILLPRRWQHARGLRLELAFFCPSVGNTLGGCALNWHSFAPALATRSGDAPRTGIPSPLRWQHAWGLHLELAFLRSCVGNTLGGCALQPDASNAQELCLHANLSIHSFSTRR